MKPEYCTNNIEECEECCFSNYGRDCHDNQIIKPNFIDEFQAVISDIITLENHLKSLKKTNLDSFQERELQDADKLLFDAKLKIGSAKYSLNEVVEENLFKNGVQNES